MRILLNLVIALLFLGLTFTRYPAQECTETPKGQIEAVLDKSTHRTLIREVISAYGEEGKLLLAEIAADKNQPAARRGQAVSLLGDYRSSAGKEVLLGMLKTYPEFCAALRPIGEYRDPSVVPTLMALLDDTRKCGIMTRFSIGGIEKEQSTPVFVSDEVVDTLEQLTGKRLEKGRDLFLIGHRATQPWKEWWRANQTAFLANPASFMAPEKNGSKPDEHYPCSVQTVAVSPDGTHVFSSGKSYDPWVREWDIKTSRQIWVAPKVEDEDVMSSIYSPDGRMIAAGTESGAVMVFDAATGRRLHTLIIGSGVNSVAFSANGSALAAACDDGRISLFDTKSWCQTKQLDNSDMTMGIAFSPDGALLASATFEKVRLWSVAEGKNVRDFEVLPGKPPRVFADVGEARAQLWRMAWQVAFSPDGKVLATGGSAAVQLWDPMTGMVKASKPSRGQVRSLFFSPDGQWVIWGSDGDEIIEWNLRSGKTRRIKNEYSMGDSALTPDGKLILSPGARTDIAIYDFQSRKAVGVLRCSKGDR